MDAEQVPVALTRVKAWLKKKAPEILEALASPASQQQIDAAERKLSVSLPEELQQFYRMHNGGEDAGLFPSAQFEDMAYAPMPLETIVESYPSARKHDSLPEGFIPFATNGAGDYYCVDGSRIVEVLHETAQQTELAPSFAAMLKDLADGLEDRRYRFDEEMGIVRVDSAATPPKKQKLPKDSDLGLWEALRLIDAPSSSDATWPIPAPPELAAALHAVDPSGEHFIRPPAARLSALLKLRIHGAAEFFKHIEPKGAIDLHGLRFYPIAQLIHLNKDHWVALPKKFPLVFATTQAGDRVCFDLTRDGSKPPVVRFPANFELKGKSPTQLAAAGKVIASDAIDFLQRLARHDLPL